MTARRCPCGHPRDYVCLDGWVHGPCGHEGCSGGRCSQHYCISIDGCCDREANLPPLEDPFYDPVHKPVAGRVPDVVIRWGKRSQLRWWRRFWAELYRQIQALSVAERNALPRDSSEYWTDSEHHKGPCCHSCFEEGELGTGVMADGWCCCRDERTGSGR